jgi:hypothetical protein
MCVEIGLIAKTELFLGSPLFAVAVILALFLAGSGLGAYLQDRLRVFRGPATLVLPPLKLLCVSLGVVPAGTFLGMFYPFGVERVVEAGAPRGRARHLRHGHAVVGVGRVLGHDRHHQPGLLGRDPDGRRGLRPDRSAGPRRAPPPPGPLGRRAPG